MDEDTGNVKENERGETPGTSQVSLTRAGRRMAEAPYARYFLLPLLLPPATKNSRAGHVCHFAQLRTRSDVAASRRATLPSTPTTPPPPTGIAVTPRIGIALPSGIRDLSPSTVGRLDLATRRLGHLPRSKTATVSRRADVTSGRERPIAPRDRAFEITNANGGNARGERKKRAAIVRELPIVSFD